MAENGVRRPRSPWVLVLAGVLLLGVGGLRLAWDSARSPWISFVGGAAMILVGLVLAVRRSASRPDAP